MRYLSQFLIILGFTLAGEVLHRLVPLPIPASVYGLVLLFLALCLGLVKLERVKQAGDFLISVMPVLFVSPMVGIAERWGLIAQHLLPIVLILLSTTALTFGLAGRITQWLIRKGGGGGA